MCVCAQYIVAEFQWDLLDNVPGSNTSAKRSKMQSERLAHGTALDQWSMHYVAPGDGMVPYVGILEACCESRIIMFMSVIV